MADMEGGVRSFAWDGDGASVGSVSNTARLEGVHTHWLYFFPVADLGASLELVRSLGGTALAPVDLSKGIRLVGCEDPQGVAFGLVFKR